MTLREAAERRECIIREIVTDDEERDAFLFSFGCCTGEAITVIDHRKGGFHQGWTLQHRQSAGGSYPYLNHT